MDVQVVRDGQIQVVPIDQLTFFDINTAPVITSLPTSFQVGIIVGGPNGTLAIARAPSGLLRAADAPEFSGTLSGTEKLPVIIDGVLYSITVEQIIWEAMHVLEGKAEAEHTHLQSEIDGLEVDLSTLQTAIATINTALAGKASTSHTHAVATVVIDGFMSSSDKSKLNGIASGATAKGTNPHAFGTPALSNSNKTITIPVSRTGSAVTVLSLSVLGASVPANGSVVKFMVLGD